MLGLGTCRFIRVVREQLYSLTIQTQHNSVTCRLSFSSLPWSSKRARGQIQHSRPHCVHTECELPCECVVSHGYPAGSRWKSQGDRGSLVHTELRTCEGTGYRKEAGVNRSSVNSPCFIYISRFFSTKYLKESCVAIAHLYAHFWCNRFKRQPDST